jgi:preprotein translocase subunit SecG
LNFDLTINYKTILTKTDWIVFFLILILTIAAVIYGQYKKKKLKDNKEPAFLDLLLMGRQLTLPRTRHI